MTKPIPRFALVLLQIAACVPLLSLAALAARAQEVPKDLQPPAGEHAVLQVHAKGDQIYTCKVEAEHFAWALKAPEAQLFDKNGKPFGKHFAGPTWKANDGSQITGRAVGIAESPDGDSIPWLLVTVVSRSGKGVLSRVTSVQRLNTQGGKAPASGCAASSAGLETRAGYAADYVFFAP